MLGFARRDGLLLSAPAQERDAGTYLALQLADHVALSASTCSRLMHAN
jgi:hypothetical protein